MKLTLKAPGSRDPVENLAFTLYAKECEESYQKINQVIEHLQLCPWDLEQIQEIFDLTDEEMELVLRRVS